MKNVTTFLMLTLAASPGMADEIDVQRQYKLYQLSDRLLDRACDSALAKEMLKKFSGIEKIELRQMMAYTSNFGVLITYPRVYFEGEHGSGLGTVNCIAPSNENRITDLTVDFDGRGLAGNMGHPMAPISPGDPGWITSFFGTTINE